MHPSRVMIAGAFLLAGVSAVSTVMAASNVDLSVVGKIIPSACTPTLSNGGIVDHGKIALQDFPSNNYKVLPKVTIKLEVTCDAPVMMAVKSTDNRIGTAVPAYPSPGQGELSRFGLGLASGGQKIGWYMLELGNAMADDIPVGMIESWDGKVWLDAPTHSYWQPGWMRTAHDGSHTPLPMTKFNTEVVVSTTLELRRSLPNAEETQIDGNATLDVIYL